MRAILGSTPLTRGTISFLGRPVRRGNAPVLSVTFAVVSLVGGIMLTLRGSVPISPYVTTISFLSYLGCRLLGRLRPLRAVHADTTTPTVLRRSHVMG